MVGWYRKFIPKFSERALPLTSLLQGQQNFHWGEAQQKSFDDLKQALATAPVLQIPDTSLDFTLQPDASAVGVGGTLLQDQGEGLKPCMYLSKKLSERERS